jgi:hypothetical protein
MHNHPFFSIHASFLPSLTFLFPSIFPRASSAIQVNHIPSATYIRMRATPLSVVLALALLLVHGVSDCVHRWTHDIHSNGILYRGIVGQNICHSGMGYIEDKAKCITLKGWIKREVYEGTFKMAARRATAALSHKIVLFVLSP